MCSDLPYTSSDCETGMVGQSQTLLAFFCMWYAIRVWDFYVKTTRAVGSVNDGLSISWPGPVGKYFNTAELCAQRACNLVLASGH